MGQTGSVCGRYVASRDAAELIEDFGADKEPEKALSADYNVAPTKRVYIVTDRAESQPESITTGDVSIPETVESTSRELHVAKWGLVPSWAKDPKIGNRMINARVETVAEKPSFRAAFSKRRCLIPADGYYEWYRPSATVSSAAPSEAKSKRAPKPAKQPFFIHPSDGSVLAMAGLFELWPDPAKDPDDPDRWLRTMTVVTTAARDELSRIHDRMPVFVHPAEWDLWLNPDLHTLADLAPVLSPRPTQWLQADPVTTAVNSVRNNGPELLNPLPAS